MAAWHRNLWRLSIAPWNCNVTLQSLVSEIASDIWGPWFNGGHPPQKTPTQIQTLCRNNFHKLFLALSLFISKGGTSCINCSAVVCVNCVLFGWFFWGVKVVYPSRVDGNRNRNSALGKWGRTQMGSDGFDRILTGFCFFSPVGVHLVPLKRHDFKGFWPDFTGLYPELNRILTGFHGIWLKSGSNLLDPLLGRPPFARCRAIRRNRGMSVH